MKLGPCLSDGEPFVSDDSETVRGRFPVELLRRWNDDITHDSWEEDGADRAWPGVWAGSVPPPQGLQALARGVLRGLQQAFTPHSLSNANRRQHQVLHLRCGVNMETEPWPSKKSARDQAPGCPSAPAEQPTRPPGWMEHSNYLRLVAEHRWNCFVV